nr:unnamed protein product [Digitaria exilis]
MIGGDAEHFFEHGIHEGGSLPSLHNLVEQQLPQVALSEYAVIAFLGIPPQPLRALEVVFGGQLAVGTIGIILLVILGHGTALWDCARHCSVLQPAAPEDERRAVIIIEAGAEAEHAVELGVRIGHGTLVEVHGDEHKITRVAKENRR